MEVSFSGPFKKSFQKRIKGTAFEVAFWKSLELFVIDPHNAKLKTHKLSGKLKKYFSFYVAYDVRVVFFMTKDSPPKAIFTDIGTHDEVY